jgi:DNA-binding NarL/FixJ family response regulator/class 3 adenylate cyclase
LPEPTALTLLFTDIEGSTRLVRVHGERWGAVLAEHRSVIREAAAEAGGEEVDARGDELFFTFADPASAVAAAVAAQRRLAAHPWPGAIPLRVRIGIHTGIVERTEDGYVGLDVHRASRICEAGHGGQVLLSRAARDAADAPARDLGEHLLAGLPVPERVFQLLDDSLPDGFPSLRATSGAHPDVRESATMRVVLADDSVLLREGMARLLEEAGFEIVGQAGNADELMLKVRSWKPDVAIVDIRMPPTQTDEGLRAAKEIRELHPDVGVLVLSQYVETAYAMELLSDSAEGVGYLLKDRIADVAEFAGAVRRVGEGGSALDPSIVSLLVGRRRESSPLEHLTPREREVLELMAEGLSNAAIAGRMFVTERAVEKHVTSIFGKLRLPPTPDAHRRVLAVLAFLNAE